MIQFKYIGEHPDLQGETALGRFAQDGHFVVQVDDHKIPGTSAPSALGDWAHGWHRTPRQDWEFVEAPKFKGSRDECADFIRANRFNLLCNAFQDEGGWVVFGVPDPAGEPTEPN